MLNFASKKKAVDRRAIDRVTGYVRSYLQQQQRSQQQLQDQQHPHHEQSHKEQQEKNGVSSAALLATASAFGEFLDDNVQIMVAEVECNQEGCVPIETLIVLVGKEEEEVDRSVDSSSKPNDEKKGGKSRRCRWSDKILKPVAEVTEEDVAQLEIPLDWNKPQEAGAAQTDNENSGISPTIKATVLDYVHSFTSVEDKLRAIQEFQALFAALEEEETKKMSIPATLANPSGGSTTAIASAFSTQTNVGPSPASTITSPTSSLSGDITPASNNSTMVTMVPMMPTTTQTSSNTSAQRATILSKMPSPLTEKEPPNTNSINSNSNASKSVATTSASIAPTISASGKRPVRTTVISDGTSNSIASERHSKGTRQRGCPCCDPDNIDNIIDRMMYKDA
jgi:hypothetical protein